MEHGILGIPLWRSEEVVEVWVPWSRAWKPTLVFLPILGQEPGGVTESTGSQQVGHWSDLAHRGLGGWQMKVWLVFPGGQKAWWIPAQSFVFVFFFLWSTVCKNWTCENIKFKKKRDRKSKGGSIGPEWRVCATCQPLWGQLTRSLDPSSAVVISQCQLQGHNSSSLPHPLIPSWCSRD